MIARNEYGEGHEHDTNYLVYGECTLYKFIWNQK